MLLTNEYRRFILIWLFATCPFYKARLCISTDDELLAVHDALEKLAAQDKPMAELVKLRFFIGLTNKESAEILDVSEPTVER